jgi:glycine/D-amino acid oxidase-like deaminating enzyme
MTRFRRGFSCTSVREPCAHRRCPRRRGATPAARRRDRRCPAGAAPPPQRGAVIGGARPGHHGLPSGADVVVVGAGLIGATIAARLAATGREVCLLDSIGPAAGTSSAGEGNLLVSDKLPGPELDLALRSLALWRASSEARGTSIELETKGGLVLAADAAELESLRRVVVGQRVAGVEVHEIGPDDLRELEPELTEALAGGAFYPDDCQLQPMRAVAARIHDLVTAGGRLASHTEVLGCERRLSDSVTSVVTSRGAIAVGTCVVNAAGPWSAEVAERLGTHLPVRPRRGHVLVTEPVADLVRHKVYEASYVGTIHAADAGVATSAVVESTKAGTVLLGSSREFVGFDRTVDRGVVAALAAGATRLFPRLAGIRLLRAYLGFRPATPDGLPIIGFDGADGKILHATGHEGSGIGLAEATGELVASLVAGDPPAVDPAPFSPARFALSTGAWSRG